MSARLRVGVLLTSTDIRAWEGVMLERVRSSPRVELAVVIMDATPGHVEADPEPRVLRSSVLHAVAAQLLESTYQRLESGIWCEHDAFAVCDATDVLNGTPIMDATPSSAVDAGVSSYDLERLRRLHLDVLLLLGSSLHSAELASAARYGLWYLDSTQYPSRSGAPPGFWEVYFGQPVTRMHLIALRANGEHHVIACSSAGTHQLSVRLNRSNAYWNALSLVPRKLDQVYSHGEQALQSPETRHLAPNHRGLAREADVSTLALQIVRNVKRRAHERLKRTLNLEQWVLLFHIGGSRPCTRIRDFRSIVPPSDRYFADPHIVYRDGAYYVFIEEYPYEKAKGHISVIRIDKDGSHGEATKVLERPYHLSYPFVFEHGGDLYMVPESMANHAVELYRCTEFPNRWEFVRNLLQDVWAVDSTLLFHAGKWWLFANLLENKGGSASEELFVFYTDCFLTGTWTSHPMNPVVSDVATARPAGPIQERDGKLYRPSQDCSVRYGYAIRINEIATLSTEEYAEREVDTIKPDWGKNVLGTHTLAYAAGLTVVDALLVRSKFGQHR
jgi:hypothetical protein